MNKKDLNYLRISIIGILIIDILVFGMIYYITYDYTEKTNYLKQEYKQLRLDYEFLKYNHEELEEYNNTTF